MGGARRLVMRVGFIDGKQSPTVTGATATSTGQNLRRLVYHFAVDKVIISPDIKIR
jgi:hypothetical protein